MSWLNNHLKAPRTTGYFWLFHLVGMGTIVLINFLTRQFNQLESLEQGVISMLVLLGANTIVCLLLRELLHRFKLLDTSSPLTWFKIACLVIVAGFLSALLTVLGLSVYYMAFGYVTKFIFFILPVIQNWLVLSLVIGLWTMVYVVVKHVEALNQAVIKLKEAELNNLIGQLNPHFLFNGLNNIRGLMLEDVKRARHMLTEISDLLRYSLQVPKHELIPLQQEMEVVNSYLALASIQYEERLNYEERIDPAAHNCKVPPLMIQLLAENAIKHGIDHTQGVGTLSLDVTIEGKWLVIQVKNPGQFNHENEKKPAGLGLNNIKQRLKLLFADQAEILIDNVKNQVKITIKMPQVIVNKRKVVA